MACDTRVFRLALYYCPVSIVYWWVSVVINNPLHLQLSDMLSYYGLWWYRWRKLLDFEVLCLVEIVPILSHLTEVVIRLRLIDWLPPIWYFNRLGHLLHTWEPPLTQPDVASSWVEHVILLMVCYGHIPFLLFSSFKATLRLEVIFTEFKYRIHIPDLHSTKVHL